MSELKTKSSFGAFVETLAIGGLIFHVLSIIAAWNLSGGVITSHYNVSGEPDANGDFSSLLILFAVNLAAYFGLTWLARYPEKFNYPWQITPDNAAEQYSLAKSFLKLVKVETVWVLALISLHSSHIIPGQTSGLGVYFVPMLIAIPGLTVIGYIATASRSAFGNARH